MDREINYLMVLKTDKILLLAIWRGIIEEKGRE